jgi:hypothetical protein
VCDGYGDTDGAYDTQILCASHVCGQWSWRCCDDTCIEAFRPCDGYMSRPDNSDETTGCGY